MVTLVRDGQVAAAAWTQASAAASGLLCSAGFFGMSWNRLNRAVALL